MKRLFVIALLIVGTATFAQNKKEDMKKKWSELEKMTPEQRAELQLKKMKLDLGLNDDQTAKVGKILTEENQKKAAKWAEMKAEMKKENITKPTADERFKMTNEMMDEQIAVKEKIKTILDEKQFDKWEKINKEKTREIARKMKAAKKHKRTKIAAAQ